jgi:hypothetical protein
MSFADAAPMLAKLIPVLGTDKPGEVVAAIEAIKRTLKAHGCDCHDLARALTAGNESVRQQHKRPWHEAESGSEEELPVERMLREIHETIAREEYCPTFWESEFLARVSHQIRYRRRLSRKQTEVVERIHRKATATSS